MGFSGHKSEKQVKSARGDHSLEANRPLDNNDMGSSSVATTYLPNRITEQVDYACGPGVKDSGSDRSAVMTLQRGPESGRDGECCQQARQFDACQWERIFNTATNGMRIIGIDHRTLYANDAFCALAGLDKSEAQGQLCHEALLGDACHTNRCPLERIAEGEKEVVYDVEKIGHDGNRRICKITATPLRDESGSLIGIIEDVQDIGPRARIEARLRESEELHRITLSHISDAVFITSDDGVFTFVCPNADVIFGYSVAEVFALGNIAKLLGKDLFDMAQLDDRGELSNVEWTVADKEGQAHYLLINIKRVSIKGGTVLYSCRDITEHKITAQELKAAINELEIERILLQNRNVALRELMDLIDQQKKQTCHQLQANVNKVVLPLLQLVGEKLRSGDQALVKLLESALSDLLDPVTDKLEKMHSNLSPREVEVCNMIRRGFSSKQIASILSISSHTVNNQRRSIRRKLQIDDNKTNLESYLKGL